MHRTESPETLLLSTSATPKSYYVYYPRGARTGGPIALHQLAASMRRAGLEAALVPFPGTEDQPDVAEYRVFEVPVHLGKVPDTPQSVVIVPEAYVPIARRFRRATTVIWWLSIDKSTTEMFRMARRRNEIWDKLFWREYIGRARHEPGQFNRRGNLRTLRRAIHIAQSQYAWSYLYATYGIVAGMVTDYTFLPSGSPAARPRLGDPSRSPRVAYNPLKGKQYVDRVKPLLRDVEWVPISGMTAPEVTKVLSSCDAYVDLGYHPGKDRIPREAALCGCVVLARRVGAAAFYGDMPLPWEAVVGQGEVDPELVAARLREMLDDLESARTRQQPYVRWLTGEEQRFHEEVRQVFVRGELGHNEFSMV